MEETEVSHKDVVNVFNDQAEGFGAKHVTASLALGVAWHGNHQRQNTRESVSPVGLGKEYSSSFLPSSSLRTQTTLETLLPKRHVPLFWDSALLST